jgi:hypothetical protein
MMQRSLIDEVLPHFDASELHELWIPAPPNVVFAAVKQVTTKRSWLRCANGMGTSPQSS